MRVGVDVGGTFTDFVFVRGDGSLHYHKVPSTPSDPSSAILRGLQDVLPALAEDVDALVHGSTVATNAVLERKGARTALVVTKGFGDAFFIGRQIRPSLYDLDVPLPVPLVAPGDVVEVVERREASGKEIVPLTDEEIARVVHALRERGVRSVAISLLFSYVEPAHEERLAAALREAGLAVSPSAEVVREYREYERTSTAVVNAYVAPVMDAYIHRLQELLPTRQFRIMQSNGGSMAPGEARRLPVHTILSGPAGGVAGASRVGHLAGHPRFITFDMGGTSCDVALHDHRVSVTSESSVEGLPLRVPVVDIHTVGAGGGSLARLDAGGALVVGPQSAGADPGPACYGRGELPTVTDANVVLGRLSERHFLGGRMQLHADRARRAVGSLADAMGASLEEVAAGVIRVVNSGMERAIRVISVERGHDVRDFALLCFGGAGGLHAVDLATSLEMPRVFVPTSPGTLSALGVLNADVIKDMSRTVLGLSLETIEAVLAELERDGRKVMAREGFADDIRVERMVDLRYAGQSYEITVYYSSGFENQFHDQHEKLFGHCNRRAAVEPARAVNPWKQAAQQAVRANGGVGSADPSLEIVNARVRLVVPTPPVQIPEIARGGEDASAAVAGVQPCWFAAWHDTPIYERDRLRAGNVIAGPAIVAEFTSTTLIAPGMTGRVDAHGNIVVEVGA